jgi:hypothetical protein
MVLIKDYVTLAIDSLTSSVRASKRVALLIHIQRRRLSLSLYSRQQLDEAEIHRHDLMVPLAASVCVQKVVHAQGISRTRGPTVKE